MTAPTWIAFLRAINLGAHRKFGKADVERVSAAAGFDDVAVYLNTGNVRVVGGADRAEVRARLEAAYLADRGFEVPTMVVSPAELRRVHADGEDLGRDHAGTRFVSFLADAPTPEAVTAFEQRWGPDPDRPHHAVVRDRAVHLLLGEDYLSGRLTNADVEKLLGPATNRTANVVATLVQRWCG